jgi:dolichol-phosphate mannosyltransferase
MSDAPSVSVILPTYEEREALERFYPLLAPVVARLRGEAIVVDDGSPDGTAAFARTLLGPPAPTVVERVGARGLASAVMAGFGRARADVLVVMDADGSHPPEAVSTLVASVTEGGAEFAMASRWVPGGDSPGLSVGRHIVSAAAHVLARPLTAVHDPMSGFFAVRRSVLSRAELAPVGYKIALEILVKCRPRPIVEVPFTFQPRLAGESKMGRREVAHYVDHLARLYAWELGPRRRASRTR